jgi:hypothetical protein
MNLIETLKKRSEEILADNMQSSEKVLVKLSGKLRQDFVLTDKHVFIIKRGFFAGQRCDVFPYSDVTSVTIKRVPLPFMGCSLRVFTKAVDTQSAILGGIGMMTFPKRKYDLYQKAIVISRELIEKARA